MGIVQFKEDFNMTRLFTDGAEFGDTLFFDTASDITAVTSNPSPRSGIYSYKPTNTNNYKSIPELSEIYVRYAIYAPVWGVNGNHMYIGWYATSTEYGRLRCADGTVNKMGYYIGATLKATATHGLTDAQWHWVELYIYIADSDGRVILYQDGVLEIDYTGDTKPSSASTINAFRFGYGPTGFGYDDIAANDTSGDSDNSWCGDGHIELLKPVNDSSNITPEWNPSSGSAHYAMVDEIPPDNDTTYISASVTGLKDAYRLSTFNGTGKNIRAIFSEGRAKDNSGESGGIKTGFYISGCSVLSSASTVLPSNYTRIIGDCTTINPVTGVAWTESDLNNIEFVIECE
jgi:hypothetical protein